MLPPFLLLPVLACSRSPKWDGATLQDCVSQTVGSLQSITAGMSLYTKEMGNGSKRGHYFPREEPAYQHTTVGDLNRSATELQAKHMAGWCVCKPQPGVHGANGMLVVGVTGAKMNMQWKPGMPLGKILSYQDVLKVS